MTEESRWTFTRGSRPEGVALYDNSAKLHSHHDTDPARGQHNSWDLVRIHRFGELDAGIDEKTPIQERPSSKAMMAFAMEQPEIRAAQAVEEMDDLGPLPNEPMLATPAAGATQLARRICDVLKNPTIPRWLLTDHIEHGVIAVMAGPRGSYKSFIALDWGCRIAKAGHCVYVVSAEGGDFDRRAKAWIRFHGNGDDSLPLYVVERRLDLSSREGVDAIIADCVRLGIRPSLFIFDTYSKLTGGVDENENSAVKELIGLWDTKLKRKETGFDATVLIIAHTGHSDAGRPRGASALAADTDAEYIVAKTGPDTVSITRERFKSSPELAPLALQSEVVRLGYHDANGTEVTSLVMKPLDHAPVKKQSNEPRGGAQKGILRQARDLLVHGPRKVDDLITEISESWLKNEGRDRRKEKANVAIGNLLREGFLYHKDGMISHQQFANATEVSPAEFDRQMEQGL